MIAVTVWWGYLLAHPALLVWGALTALAVLTAAAIIRLTADPPGGRNAPRPGPRSRAGETRAWLRVHLSGVRGWARPTTPGDSPAEITKNAGHGASPDQGATDERGLRLPTRATWARKAIARRIQTLRTWWAFTRPRRQPSTEEREAMALWQLMREDDTGGFLALPATGVTVKISGGDQRAAVRAMDLPELPPDELDASCTYRDWPPLASMLSDDTIARGLAAIVDGA